MKNTNKTLKSLIGGGVTFLLIFALAGFTAAKTSEGDKSDVALSQFGKIPAFFIENKGQTAKEVKYYFKGNDNVYFTDDGVMFQKIETQKRETGIEDSNVGAGLPRPHKDGDAEAVEARALAYKLEFIGARPTSPQARNELKGKVNYLIGNDRSKWHSNIPTYQEIVYHGLYPRHSENSTDIKFVVYHEDSMVDNEVYLVDSNGIDLVYKGVPGGMKYEFIVQPGADPDVIRLAYTGIEGLSIDDSGNLIIHTSLGDVKDSKPYCYQEIDGKQVEVGCNFKIIVSENTPPTPLLLEGRPDMFPSNQEENGVLFPLYQEGIKGCVVNASMKNREKERFVYGFQVSSYNKASPLIIDPGLEYSTFLGGGSAGQGIAVDGSGNAYVAGTTGSSSFPTTAGAFDESRNGSSDAFVTKLNTTGTALEYSTFLGGGSWDGGYGIAVDGSGNAYVTGWTASSDFPTTAGAFDTSYNGGSNAWGWDAFVSKLSPSGAGVSDLLYSTFLGGSNDDGGIGIAVDGSGNAYVTGWTWSSDFPTTAGAFDTSYNGGDAFVTKLGLWLPEDCTNGLDDDGGMGWWIAMTRIALAQVALRYVMTDRITMGMGWWIVPTLIVPITQLA